MVNKQSILDEFFNSNICIPKGANRHPYADSYHAFLEGATCEMVSKNGHTVEIKYLTPLTLVALEEWCNIRIKPSEPTYEWQWLCTNGGYATLTEWLTEDEIKDSEVDEEVCKWVKIKETKRERK
jgi:hypothetical protein